MTKWHEMQDAATLMLDEAIAEGEPSAVADFLEWVAAERKHIKNYDNVLRNLKALADSNLVVNLGDGDVVEAPSTGRVVFRTTEPVGAARVSQDAVVEHQTELPDNCRPKEVLTFPGVMMLREAAELGKISEELLDELLIKPEPAVVLRWRTLQDFPKPVRGGGE